MHPERIVHVRHPCPVVLRLKRHRTRMLWDIVEETPVALRAVSPDELGPPIVAPTPEGPLTWRAFEGALWFEPSGRSRFPSVTAPWQRFGVDAFAAYLEGGMSWDRIDVTDVGKALFRSPLFAMGPGGRRPTRGVPWVPERLGPSGTPVAEVCEDGRAAAAEDLRRFMAERVLVVGDAVLLRTYDPLVDVVRGEPVLQPFPQAWRWDGQASRRERLGFRPDACDDGLHWEAGSGGEPRRVWRTGWLDALAGTRFGGDTARLLAELALSGLDEALAEMQAKWTYFLARPATPGAGEAVADAYAAASPWIDRAWQGRVRPEEAPAAVAVARRLHDAMVACFEPVSQRPVALWRLEALLRRFEQYEWPLARAQAADEEAIAGIAWPSPI